MSDERRRRAERRARTGDASDKGDLLLQRMRAGEVSDLQVEIAAALGDPTALAVLGSSAPKRLDPDYDQRLHAALGFAGPWVAVSWGADLLADAPSRTVHDESDVNIIKDRVVRAARQLLADGKLPARLTERLARTSSALEDLQPCGSEVRSIADAVAAFAVGLDWFPLGSEGPIPRTRRVATQVAGAHYSLAIAAWRGSRIARDRRPTGALEQRAKDAKIDASRAAMLRLAKRVLQGVRDGDGGAEWVTLRVAEEKREASFQDLLEQIMRDVKEARGGQA